MCGCKGSFSASFDNMFKYGLLKRTSGDTYYDNLYMIRNTQDGKFQMGIFLQNTHLLTKRFPYQLPGPIQKCVRLVNSSWSTSSIWRIQCASPATGATGITWGSFWGNDLVFTAERFENDYFEGRFEGNMRTGSGRIAKVTNGRFRIKLTRMPEDVVVP